MEIKRPLLAGFFGIEDDVTTVEELEPKLAPDDQQPAGFLD